MASKSLDMTPRSSNEYVRYSAGGYTKSFSNRYRSCAIGSLLPYIWYIFLSKLCKPNHRTDCFVGPATLNHVCRIVLIRAFVQVCRIAARWIIAVVENTQRWLCYCNSVCNTMGEVCCIARFAYTPYIEHAISKRVAPASPWPTFCGRPFGNSKPEALNLLFCQVYRLKLWSGHVALLIRSDRKSVA